MEADFDAHCTILQALCSKAREILVEECNVQRVDAPVTAMTSKLRKIASFPSSLCTASKSYVISSVVFNLFMVAADIQDLRGHPWPVLRFGGAVQGRKGSRQLLIGSAVEFDPF